MKFVKKVTPPDFTPSISPNFNSFSKKRHKKSENGEIYTADKNFTLPPALTAWTNSTSAWNPLILWVTDIRLKENRLKHPGVEI